MSAASSPEPGDLGAEPSEVRDLGAEAPTQRSAVQFSLNLSPGKVSSNFGASFAAGSFLEKTTALALFTLATAVPPALFAGLCKLLGVSGGTTAVVLISSWLISMAVWSALLWLASRDKK